MAKSYKHLGLDSRLRKKGGISSNERRFTSGNEFDATFDSSLITSSRLFGSVVTDDNIVGMAATKILAGTIEVSVDVGTAAGGAYVRLDGVNNRIIVNDGTTDRIIIGNI